MSLLSCNQRWALIDAFRVRGSAVGYVYHGNECKGLSTLWTRSENTPRDEDPINRGPLSIKGIYRDLDLCGIIDKINSLAGVRPESRTRRMKPKLCLPLSPNKIVDCPWQATAELEYGGNR